MNEFFPAFKNSATYQILGLFWYQLRDFFETLGQIGQQFVLTMRYIIKFQVGRKSLIEQSSRFSVDSLPITLSIVAMSTVIIAMQIAPEMAKQGGASFVGMLVSVVTVRELGPVMAGFAIISMIGSAFASEIATMRVTEQIDAIEVLHVDPIWYLFVPRVLAGFIMMPFVVVISSTVGIFAGGLASVTSCPDISWISYIDSLWYGFHMKDVGVCLLKASAFGGAITIVSCSCGYFAKGGAKGVGRATTKAVVWSFITIAILDFIFAAAFYL